jgi:hypothetical protein
MIIIPGTAGACVLPVADSGTVQIKVSLIIISQL